MNRYPALYTRCATGEVQTSGTLLGAADIRTYPFYHEWLKDFTRGSGATLLRDKKRLLHFSINIPDCIGHIEPYTAHLLRTMAPHVLRAFQLNERLEAQTVATAVLDNLMDRLDGMKIATLLPLRVSRDGDLLTDGPSGAVRRETAEHPFATIKNLDGKDSLPVQRA
jgi:hypothetical protein